MHHSDPPLDFNKHIAGWSSIVAFAAVCFDLLRMSNNGAVYPQTWIPNESAAGHRDRDAAKVCQQRRQPNNRDLGSENERIKQKLSGRSVAEMGMAIAVTRVRLQPTTNPPQRDEMATASVCSSPSARTDGVTCLALRRNEAYSGQRAVTFQIRFHGH